MLIVLRLCVPHVLRPCSRGKTLKESWQNRHLEQVEDYFGNFNDRMDGKRRNPLLL
jgi:hypothetical protein